MDDRLPNALSIVHHISKQCSKISILTSNKDHQISAISITVEEVLLELAGAMKYFCLTAFATLLACFVVLPIDGFSVATKSIIRQNILYGHPSPFYKQKQTIFRSSPSDDVEDPKQTDGQAAKTDESEKSTLSTKDSSQSWGVTKTILLAVPLFFKFLVVLVIKFMTDLVVFPLLFSYRMCRRAKRKVLRMFNKKHTDLPNGETHP